LVRGNWKGGRLTDITGEVIQDDHVPVPSIISGTAEGELTNVSFQNTITAVYPVINQLFTVFLVPVFSVCGFMLAGQKNNDYIEARGGWFRVTVAALFTSMKLSYVEPS